MVVVRLPETRRLSKLKYMSRFTFAAVASLVVSGAATAQQVPGRDLLEFPIGLLAEAPALSTRMPGGLWNPAASSLAPGLRAGVGFAGLTTPAEQGIDVVLLGSEFRVRSGITASVSYASASVRDLFRTATDPQTLGGEIAYSTSLLSLGVAGGRGPVTVGVATRLRNAQFDSDRSSALSLDAGVRLDSIGHLPVRIAASTFLFTPDRSKDAATYSAAADVPLVRRDTTLTVRGGYSLSHTEGRGQEHYFFSTASLRQVDASAGITHFVAYGHTSDRLRLGLDLRVGEFTVAFGREDGAGGIGASYQMMLSRVFR